MPAQDLFLRESKSFQIIINEGRKSFSPHFILYTIERTDTKCRARLGIIVPKKTVSLASKRNRIKRVLREIWRSKRKDADNKDYLLMVKKDVFKKTYDQICEELNKSFNKFLS